MTELEIARAVAAGALPSPQDLGGSSLFALRITGTGTAFRAKHDEHVYRPPEHYLSDDFLARCAGLTVAWGHPAGEVMTSDEFAVRAIGSVILPYVAGSDGVETADGTEVWGRRARLRRRRHPGSPERPALDLTRGRLSPGGWQHHGGARRRQHAAH